MIPLSAVWAGEARDYHFKKWGISSDGGAAPDTGPTLSLGPLPVVPPSTRRFTPTCSMTRAARACDIFQSEAMLAIMIESRSGQADRHRGRNCRDDDPIVGSATNMKPDAARVRRRRRRVLGP